VAVAVVVAVVVVVVAVEVTVTSSMSLTLAFVVMIAELAVSSLNSVPVTRGEARVSVASISLILKCPLNSFARRNLSAFFSSADLAAATAAVEVVVIDEYYGNSIVLVSCLMYVVCSFSLFSASMSTIGIMNVSIVTEMRSHHTYYTIAIYYRTSLFYRVSI